MLLIYLQIIFSLVSLSSLANLLNLASLNKLEVLNRTNLLYLNKFLYEQLISDENGNRILMSENKNLITNKLDEIKKLNPYFNRRTKKMMENVRSRWQLCYDLFDIIEFNNFFHNYAKDVIESKIVFLFNLHCSQHLRKSNLFIEFVKKLEIRSNFRRKQIGRLIQLIFDVQFNSFTSTTSLDYLNNLNSLNDYQIDKTKNNETSFEQLNLIILIDRNDASKNEDQISNQRTLFLNNKLNLKNAIKFIFLHNHLNGLYNFTMFTDFRFKQNENRKFENKIKFVTTF